MDDKSLKRNRKLCNQENLVPFLNKTSSLYLTWSFNSGLFNYNKCGISSSLYWFRFRKMT